MSTLLQALERSEQAGLGSARSKCCARGELRMFEARRRNGQDIHLDIEPEPDGLVETTEEFIQFFERLLRTGAPLLAKSAQLSLPQAEEALRQHVAFCYDLCHSTVEYEESRTVIDALRNAGVRIGRVQVSSAVKVAGTVAIGRARRFG